ncbi:nitroreductase/quinone reductase family protein [Micromonospora sp. NPDC005305]|uniref:nitroreductase/quinone reductase family protein n=1 Tax=Micromonospora sp. NPDC005305 TaxID=3156875 RepID=UPI0033B6620A
MRLERGFPRTAGWLYRRSRGKIGGKMFGAPLLLLAKTGRKSGRSWTVPGRSYIMRWPRLPR